MGCDLGRAVSGLGEKGGVYLDRGCEDRQGRERAARLRQLLARTQDTSNPRRRSVIIIPDVWLRGRASCSIFPSACHLTDRMT
jgi:hypothetical protein